MARGNRLYDVRLNRHYRGGSIEKYGVIFALEIRQRPEKFSILFGNPARRYVLDAATMSTCVAREYRRLQRLMKSCP